MEIAIVSGKGGTGKTTVAVGLALSSKGAHLLDADVDEPNCSLFLGLETKIIGTSDVLIPVIDKEKCTLCGKCNESCQYNALIKMPDEILLFDKMCHGCGVCTYVCPEDAITEKPRVIGSILEGKNDDLLFHFGEIIVGEELSTPVISRLKEEIKGDEEVVIIDSPPGSACPMVETISDCDYIVVVSEPTPFGLSDMKIVVETLRIMNRKFGVIINKDGVGDEELEKYCVKENIPILMKIPFDLEIARNYSTGKTLIDLYPKFKEEFRDVLVRIQEMI
ncbi:MAG: P-loop NTPase [Candidatus Heimdallarchaeota archaeon]|nr:P-loop NTPase [Candidatus Heimdallarchaeota archaeon]